jgi:hypothetical protein
MTDTSPDYVARVLGAAPFADQESGIPQMCDLIRAMDFERDLAHAFEGETPVQRIATIARLVSENRAFAEQVTALVGATNRATAQLKHMTNSIADLGGTHAMALGELRRLLETADGEIKTLSEYLLQALQDNARLTDFVREVADWKIEELPQSNPASPEDELDAVMYSAAAESFIEDAQSLMQGRDDPE